MATHIQFFFFSSRRRHTRSTRDWSSDVCSSDLPFPRCRGVEHTAIALDAPLQALGGELRAHGWELAIEVVEEGLLGDVIPALVRLGRMAQLGDLPTFIAELGREVQDPLADRMRVAGPLAGIARDHARRREELGFAPRDVVTEFLLLRRVLWRFVATRVGAIGSDELF